MSKQEQKTKYVYVNSKLPALIKLHKGQTLIIANSRENFENNYMIVSSLKLPKGHFLDMAIAGVRSQPGMREGTYIARMLVAEEAGAEGELYFGLGYAHIGKVEETKTVRYKILS